MKTNQKVDPKRKKGINQTGKCVGPVADLEKHLPVEWWRSIFNSIYLKTDADVVENDEATKNEIELLLQITKAEPSDSFLDLCCGQGRHCLELARRGFQFITGIDRSRFLVRLAKNRALKAGLSIKFSEGDARRLRIPDQCLDCITVMGNSFGYFEQENDDLKVLREANRILRTGGVLYLDVTDGLWMREHFERRSWEWIDEELLVCRERNLAADTSRLISREVVVHAEKGVIADQFYAERLYSFEELKTQLEKSGFINIRKHDNLQGNSFRNQDLGMMANRMIVTAGVPERTAAKPLKRRKSLTCTVLMGDPRLGDPVKKDGKFSSEDFETIHKMKETLKSVEGFHFTFLDDHKSLLRKFMQNPPAFVFNLCDEGWNNNPTMELHPPALMEMLQIPYTGAGPECLSVCYNKSLVRAAAQEMDISVPSEIWIDPFNHSAAIPSVFPAIVKPAFGDSSVGITQHAVVHCAEELVDSFDRLKREMPGVPILIQEFLEGKEFSVGILGNGDSVDTLPILEVDYSELPSNLPQLLGYESKWHPESPYWTKIRYKPAEISETVSRNLIESSIALFHRLKCRDYTRMDFRMNNSGEVKLLEVNPNPGWCWDGKMALMAAFAGMSYAQLLEKVLQAGLDRYPNIMENEK